MSLLISAWGQNLPVSLLISAWGQRLKAALSVSSSTHLNLRQTRQCLSCIVGYVGTWFWQGRRMCIIKKMISLNCPSWFRWLSLIFTLRLYLSSTWSNNTCTWAFRKARIGPIKRVFRFTSQSLGCATTQNKSCLNKGFTNKLHFGSHSFIQALPSNGDLYAFYSPCHTP